MLLYMTTFYFPYCGGKKSEYKYIKKYLDDEKYDLFIEPFCGSSATSYLNYKNGKKNIKYILNDNDIELINFLKCIQETGSKPFIEEVNMRLCGLTKEKHDLYVKRHHKNRNDPNDFFYYRKIYNYRVGLFDINKVNKVYCHSKFIKFDEFYKNVKLSNLDYLKIFKKYKNNKDAFLYLDPPYLDSSNSSYYYTEINNDNEENKIVKIVDNSRIYVDILNFLKNCKCKVIMIINKNSLSNFLYGKYVINEYDKIYSHIVSKNNVRKMTKHIVIGKNIIL